jgi:hypothetical protein
MCSPRTAFSWSSASHICFWVAVLVPPLRLERFTQWYGERLRPVNGHRFPAAAGIGLPFHSNLLEQGDELLGSLNRQDSLANGVLG